MTDRFLGKRLIAAARLANYEREVEKAINRALAKRRLAVEARALTASGGDDFDEDEWDTDIADEVEPVVAEMMEKLAAATISQFPLGPDAGRVLGKIDLSSQVEQFIAVIKGIGPDTARRINEALSQGVGLGESVPELAERVDGIFAMASRRAATIARTETNKAANAGLNQAAATIHETLPLTKSWLATGDDRTRDDHADADGQTVGFDEQFEVGGELADYPCDPNLSAEQVVCCRCTTTFAAADDGAVSDEDQQAVDAAEEAAQ